MGIFSEAREIVCIAEAHTYVYIDPPYQGVTGYSANLSPRAVVELAKSWVAAGADCVAVSEAAPLKLGKGWESICITDSRKGQTRTAGTEEWLTFHRRDDAT